MQYGDISNQRGPAIVLNADLLIEIKKKWLGLRSEIGYLLSTRNLLEQWFIDGDLGIYIVCMGEYAKHIDRIEDMLDTFSTPYTNIQVITSPFELSFLVNARHVVGYFYNQNTLVDERTVKRKHFQVPNVAEINYILEGNKYVGTKD